MADFVIGRDPGCDIVIRNPTVSRRHAELSRTGEGAYLIVDQNSTSGTFVQGPNGWTKVTRANVRDADRIRLGAYEITIGEMLEKAGGLNAARADAGKVRVERDPETGEIIVKGR